MADRVTPLLDAKKDLSNLFDLKGQVAFVPGGSGGLGEAICWGLAQSGAAVVVGGRERDKADELAAALEKAGYRASAAAFDAGDVGQIRQVVDQVAKEFGRLDILVNCVGI